MAGANKKFVSQKIWVPFLDNGDQCQHLLFIGGKTQIFALECLTEKSNWSLFLHQYCSDSITRSIAVNNFFFFLKNQVEPKPGLVSLLPETA